MQVADGRRSVGRIASSNARAPVSCTFLGFIIDSNLTMISLIVIARDTLTTRERMRVYKCKAGDTRTRERG